MAKKIKTKKIEDKKPNTSRAVPEKVQEQKSKILEATPNKEEQMKKNNKLLIAIFSLLGIILFAFFMVYFLIGSKNSFDYKGVKFDIIKEGNLIFYNTQLPIYSNTGKEISTYNFYLRTDPRELGKMKFNETIQLLKFVALNYSSDMDCQGYGTIALQNIINLYELIGAKVVIDKNATCDTEGRYMFLNIQKANETSLEKVGNNCYDLNVKDCAIFLPTERFMLDTFVKIKQDDIHAVYSGVQPSK